MFTQSGESLTTIRDNETVSQLNEMYRDALTHALIGNAEGGTEFRYCSLHAPNYQEMGRKQQIIAIGGIALSKHPQTLLRIEFGQTPEPHQPAIIVSREDKGSLQVDHQGTRLFPKALAVRSLAFVGNPRPRQVDAWDLYLDVENPEDIASHQSPVNTRVANTLARIICHNLYRRPPASSDKPQRQPHLSPIQHGTPKIEELIPFGATIHLQ